MDASEFEAKLKREGFLEVERKQGQPNFASAPHTHPYDVQAFVIDGEITLGREGRARTFRAGETFELAAGCLHTEQYGPAGYTFLVGRRHPAG